MTLSTGAYGALKLALRSSLSANQYVDRFPATVTPLVRLRGDAASYQDLAGTIRSDIGNKVRHANNVSPLSGYWQAPTDLACRKDPMGFALEPVDPGVAPAVFEWSAGPGTQINLNDSTIFVSWVQRYPGAFSLLAPGGAAWGLRSSFGVTAVINGAENALFSPVMGARHSLVVRYMPTGLLWKAMTNGAVSGSGTIPVVISPGHPAYDNIVLGHDFSVYYGSCQEAGIVNRAVTDGEAEQLLAFIDSVPSPPAFSTAAPVLLIAGDSNAVGVGTDQFSTYKFSILRALRSTQNMEMVSAAVVGASASSDFSLTLAPFYSAARAKHVCIFAAGANDLAVGSSAAATLAVAFATMDKLRAIGGGGKVKVIACALPDRNGLFSGGQTHAGYRAAKATFDAGLVASVGLHCDAFADWNTVPEVAADGAADNLTYFSSDKVHIASAGHQKLQALMLGSVNSLL